MKFNIFVEGYIITGAHSGAQQLAENIEADSFLEACLKWHTQEDKLQYFKIEKGVASYWACREFDNLHAAQKEFG